MADEGETGASVKFPRCECADERPGDSGGPVVFCQSCGGWIAVTVYSMRDVELFAEKFQ